MGKTVTSSVITPSWGQGDPSGPFPDTRSGTLAGRDHITGNPVVTTPGASSPTVGNIGAGGKVGTSVTLRVLNPNSGGRSVEVATGTTGSTSKKVTSFVTTKTSVSITTKPECDTRTPPPKKDPPEDDPEEPGKPPQGDGPISPPIPAPSDSPPTTGNPGCEPTSNTKWFAGSCPPGTQSLGSATLADGSVRSLCKGPSGKPSGCEPPVRWVCDSTIGSCVKSSTGGGYDTFEACMGAGCKRLRFSCVDGNCVEKEDGEFPTYDACLSGACELRYWIGTYYYEPPGSCGNPIYGEAYVLPLTPVSSPNPYSIGAPNTTPPSGVCPGTRRVGFYNNGVYVGDIFDVTGPVTFIKARGPTL